MDDDVFKIIGKQPLGIISAVIAFIINNRDEYWKLISKVQVEEPFPQPTKNQIVEVVECTKRILQSPYYKNDKEKIALVFYNLIKNHYFANGNKRFAAMFTICLIIAKGEPNKNLNKMKNYFRDIALEVASEVGHENQVKIINKIQTVLLNFIKE